MRASLRLLEEREQKLQLLQQALIEGEESGDDSELDIEEIKRESRREAQLEGPKPTNVLPGAKSLIGTSSDK